MKIGLQLYSVRDDMAISVPKTIEQVAKIGYKYVEFAGYFGYSANELRDIVESNGLECLSVHQSLNSILENPAEQVEYLSKLGIKYYGIPSLKSEQLMDIENTAKELTAASKALGEAGITLMYHNHDFEFVKHNGSYLLDNLYTAVPSNVLKAEFDVCWLHYANANPCEYIKKYSDRCPVIHLKDFMSESFKANSKVSGEPRYNKDKEADGFMYKPVGQGAVDIEAVVSTALNSGTKYFIVEMDSSKEKPPLIAAKESFQYLKNLEEK